MLFDYDDSNEKSILYYAKKLEHRSFRSIMEEYKKSPVKKYTNHSEYDSFEELTFAVEEPSVEYHTNKNAKGELGNLLEQYYFGYKPNSKQEADFPKVGIELKQTCVDKKKNGKLTAGERLSITNISYENPIEPDFYKSHVWEKIKNILLIHYLRDKTKERLDYEILFVNLFTPPEKDIQIIIEDYNKINKKIEAGLAHEISESDTLYLGACTKGSTALKSQQPQYYGDKKLAKKRNFCFKRSYMDYILQNYIMPKACESIIDDNISLKETTFEKYIINKINMYSGKTDKELCEMYNLEYTGNKAQWVTLAYRMLGIKGNKAEEFMKANIKVKTIRLNKNNKINEHMSFPAFQFKEIINEDWETSELFNYFNETKFLFVVFKEHDDFYTLQGAQLWNMPYDDLNDDVHEVWKDTQSKIKNGVKIWKGKSKVFNNLPCPKDNLIMHVRPHTKHAAYKLHNGFEMGDIKKDANELPNGEWMTTQSFWLNKEYILSQLKIK